MYRDRATEMSSARLSLLSPRRNAVPCHQERASRDGIARRVVVLDQTAADALFECPPVRKDNQAFPAGDAGPERASQRAREEFVQLGMEQPARRQAVIGFHDNDAAG